MAIQVLCRVCLRSLAVQETSAGKLLPCPDCHEPVRIPGVAGVARKARESTPGVWTIPPLILVGASALLALLLGLSFGLASGRSTASLETVTEISVPQK